MTTLREAAQQALEALECAHRHSDGDYSEKIKALRAALAEPVKAAMTRDRRERIATAAMVGLMANTQWLPPDTTYPHIAEYAVRAADALIAELDKPKEGGA